MPGFFGEQTSDAEVGLRDAGLSDFAGEPIQFPLLYLCKAQTPLQCRVFGLPDVQKSVS